MKLPIYQIDAFTSRPFGGNPAAVCSLEAWLPDELMQNIAMENNLADTAFFVKEGNHFGLRWFTPTIEVDLCGHATLATAFVLFNYMDYRDDVIRFQTRSGQLTVTRKDDHLMMDFPADVVLPEELSPALLACCNEKPVLACKGKTDYMLIFEDEQQIRELEPDPGKIARLPARGLIVTAKGNRVDFVSRFFAPQAGVNEDAVTGSAHTTLTPFWASRLNKTEMTAMQLSQRGGNLSCALKGDRVIIGGQCRAYSSGEITV